MQLFLKTPPIQEPLSLEEVKAYLHVSSDQEDDTMRLLIASARAHVESVTGRSLLKQKWMMQLTPPYPRTSPLVKWAGKELEILLPRPPLLEIESVMIEGEEIPFKMKESKISFSSAVMERDLSVTYWAGYGEIPSALPPDLRMATLMATRFLYDQHKVELPLLHPYKVHRVV